MKTIDWDEPYEEVFGFGGLKYRYIQNGMYFNNQGIRVKEDGSFWTDRDQAKVDEVKAVIEAAKSDERLKNVAKAAQEGIILPKRVLTLSKEKK